MMVSEKLNHSLGNLDKFSIDDIDFDFTEIVYKFRTNTKFDHMNFAESIESFFEDYNVKLKKKFPFFNSQKRIYVWNAYDGIRVCPEKNWSLDFELKSQSDIELRGTGSDKNGPHFSIFENSLGKRFTVYKNYTKKSQ